MTGASLKKMSSINSSPSVTKLNMALASDTLFDKFGLWPNLNVNVDASLANLDLDLGLDDLLTIKEEPLFAGDQEANFNDDMDPFFAMMSDDASLDSIKSDCMWSSASQIIEASRKRRRDVSLTLSECAEGLLSINHLDVNMLDAVPTLGSTPTFMSNLGAFEEEEASTASEDDEEDEIDVVGGHDLVGSSARTRHAAFRPKATPQTHMVKKIEAGRSLLKKKQDPVVLHGLEKHKTILDDHCYFSSSRPTPAAMEPVKGIMTPNESSEDEDDPMHTGGTTTISVDKRKIAEAVQSLIKNRQMTSEQSNVKFRFRMKFKSTKKPQPQTASEVTVKTEPEEDSSRARRKSASKNAYCPPPTSTASPRNSPLKRKASNSLLASSASATKKSCNFSSSSSTTSSTSSLNDNEKCREIRDLHNSMERQRRVEQRNHLAHLKKQVPEVADVEKASKLTILRKAMDYCHYLSSADLRLRKDKDREAERQRMLKKRLLEVSQRLDARRVTSGRRY